MPPGEPSHRRHRHTKVREFRDASAKSQSTTNPTSGALMSVRPHAVPRQPRSILLSGLTSEREWQTCSAASDSDFGYAVAWHMQYDLELGLAKPRIRPSTPQRTYLQS